MELHARTPDARPFLFVQNLPLVAYYYSLLLYVLFSYVSVAMSYAKLEGSNPLQHQRHSPHSSDSFVATMRQLYSLKDMSTLEDPVL